VTYADRPAETALPGFKAISVDFSTGGLQVEAEGEVAVGREIQIRLEFDAAGLAPLECLARVAWSAPRPRSRAVLGLQFVHLDAGDRACLELYQQYLMTREDGTILQRTVYETVPGHGNGSMSQQEPACGRIVSYSVDADHATIVFRTRQGPTLRMRFEDYRGLTDSGRATGREVTTLRDAPGQGYTRYQFLDARDQLILEVLAADCMAELRSAVDS
jgi:hypothetical protein